jgi:hypothetical protein
MKEMSAREFLRLTAILMPGEFATFSQQNLTH